MCHKIHFDIRYISNLFVLEHDSKNNVSGLLEKINILREEVLKNAINRIYLHIDMTIDVYFLSVYCLGVHIQTSDK